MPFLIQQTDLLSRIANYLHNEVEAGYKFLSSEFDIFGVGSVKTAASTISVDYGNGIENRGFSDSTIFEVTDLVVDLHNLMKVHTGGEWTSFTLTLDANGKAHTKFHYPEDPA